MKPQKVFDSLLVLQYQRGDKKALELLVNRHHTRFCRQAHWYVRDVDVSQDIAQECWATIISKIHSLKDPNSFGSWAMRIVTRKSLDFVKRNARNRERLKQYKANTGISEEDDDRSVEIKKLKEAMGTLGRDQQIVLRLFYTEEYALKEIAEILDINIGTVKSRLFHAREKLKTILKQ